MDLAKPGLIQKYCRTNALMTFKEYLEDYATPATKEAGNQLISQMVNEPGKEETNKMLSSTMKRIENGERDLYV